MFSFLFISSLFRLNLGYYYVETTGGLRLVSRDNSKCNYGRVEVYDSEEWVTISYCDNTKIKGEKASITLEVLCQELGFANYEYDGTYYYGFGEYYLDTNDEYVGSQNHDLECGFDSGSCDFRYWEFCTECLSNDKLVYSKSDNKTTHTVCPYKYSDNTTTCHEQDLYVNCGSVSNVYECIEASDIPKHGNKKTATCYDRDGIDTSSYGNNNSNSSLEAWEIILIVLSILICLLIPIIIILGYYGFIPCLILKEKEIIEKKHKRNNSYIGSTEVGIKIKGNHVYIRSKSNLSSNNSNQSFHNSTKSSSSHYSTKSYNSYLSHNSTKSNSNKNKSKSLTHLNVNNNELHNRNISVNSNTTTKSRDSRVSRQSLPHYGRISSIEMIAMNQDPNYQPKHLQQQPIQQQQKIVPPEPQSPIQAFNTPHSADLIFNLDPLMPKHEETNIVIPQFEKNKNDENVKQLNENKNSNNKTTTEENGENSNTHEKAISKGGVGVMNLNLKSSNKNSNSVHQGPDPFINVNQFDNFEFGQES